MAVGYNSPPYTPTVRGGGSGYFLNPDYVPSQTQIVKSLGMNARNDSDKEFQENIRAEKERLSDAQRRGVRGRASTILTSQMGLMDDAPSARKILLGA